MHPWLSKLGFILKLVHLADIIVSNLVITKYIEVRIFDILDFKNIFFFKLLFTFNIP